MVSSGYYPPPTLNTYLNYFCKNFRLSDWLYLRGSVNLKKTGNLLPTLLTVKKIWTFLFYIFPWLKPSLSYSLFLCLPRHEWIRELVYRAEGNKKTLFVDAECRQSNKCNVMLMAVSLKSYLQILDICYERLGWLARRWFVLSLFCYDSICFQLSCLL